MEPCGWFFSANFWDKRLGDADGFPQNCDQECWFKVLCNIWFAACYIAPACMLEPCWDAHERSLTPLRGRCCSLHAAASHWCCSTLSAAAQPACPLHTSPLLSRLPLLFRWAPFQTCEQQERYHGLFEVPGAWQCISVIACIGWMVHAMMHAKGCKHLNAGTLKLSQPCQLNCSVGHGSLWLPVQSIRQNLLNRLSSSAVWDMESEGLFSKDASARNGKSVYQVLVGIFDAAYGGNRAPVPLFVHGGWLQENVEDVARFVGALLRLGCGCLGCNKGQCNISRDSGWALRLCIKRGVQASTASPADWWAGQSEYESPARLPVVAACSFVLQQSCACHTDGCINRPPQPHLSTHPAHPTADYALAKPGTFFVTVRQLLAWLQNPQPAAELTAAQLGCGRPGGAPGPESAAAEEGADGSMGSKAAPAPAPQAVEALQVGAVAPEAAAAGLAAAAEAAAPGEAAAAPGAAAAAPIAADAAVAAVVEEEQQQPGQGVSELQAQQPSGTESVQQQGATAAVSRAALESTQPSAASGESSGGGTSSSSGGGGSSNLPAIIAGAVGGAVAAIAAIAVAALLVQRRRRQRAAAEEAAAAMSSNGGWTNRQGGHGSNMAAGVLTNLQRAFRYTRALRETHWSAKPGILALPAAVTAFCDWLPPPLDLQPFSRS